MSAVPESEKTSATTSAKNYDASEAATGEKKQPSVRLPANMPPLPPTCSVS